MPVPVVFLALLTILWVWLWIGKPIIIEVRRFPGAPWAAGLNILMFIWVKMDYPDRAGLIRHEMVHIRQQRIWSPLLFPILYGAAILWGKLKGKSWKQAYWDSPFEKEARGEK